MSEKPSKTPGRQTYSHHFNIGVATSLAIALGLAVVGQTVDAHNIIVEQCGEHLGPGSYVLVDDLGCDATSLTEEGTALTIRGPAYVNLNGYTLSCEEGTSFTAILLLGERVIVKAGTITGCNKGLQVNDPDVDESGPTGRHKLLHLNVINNTGGRGIEVRSDGNRLAGNVVSNNAEEGLRIRNANYNRVLHNLFYNNGDHGARVRDGNGNYFLGNTAVNNGSVDTESGKGSGEGFKLRGDNNIALGNTAVGNVDNGFGIDRGLGNRLAGNYAANNGRQGDQKQQFAGIAVGGTGSRIVKNTLLNNTEFDALDGNKHCDDNLWRRNVFSTSAFLRKNEDGDMTEVIENPDCIR